MMWRENPANVRPMLASIGEAPLDSPDFAYEPKYDGIRAVVAIEPKANRASVKFWSRLGNEKTTQFPELASAIERWARPLHRPVVIDGEIVALDARGDPCGFQNLQGRIHGAAAIRRGAAEAVGGPTVAFVAFDILRDGTEDLRDRPLRERRARLESLFAGPPDPAVRISEHLVGQGKALRARAEQLGWEGIIAKRLDAAYKSGRRVPDWRKVKLVRHQTCVIGGWTEPRGSRPFFGALLLGVYEGAALRYIGHTGAGFSDAELGRVWRRLHAIETTRCPFDARPKTNEMPHWVKPKLVAEVKFTEWTADAKLRHPTYLGLRDDVDPATVRREPEPLKAGGAGRARKADGVRPTTRIPRAMTGDLLGQIDAIVDQGGNGALLLPGDERLEVTNLTKIYWPKGKLTKGDLLRHYVRVAPHILPVLADRPLVLKRYPNGVAGKPFYQHRAPDKVPSGVHVAAANAGDELRPHIVGGSLATLLYTAQLGSISQDPWLSRVHTEGTVDHVALDLDPPAGLPFRRVLDAALWVRDELSALKAPAFPKTSGAGGLHVYVPMPPGTPYEAGLLFGQIVATLVAKKHPRSATVERSIKARGNRIYVDYLQNVRGKTLASAYSARASEFAGVSTPLTWDEVEKGISPRDFSIQNFADRLAAVPDLWAALRKSPGANLSNLQT